MSCLSCRYSMTFTPANTEPYLACTHKNSAYGELKSECDDYEYEPGTNEEPPRLEY